MYGHISIYVVSQYIYTYVDIYTYIDIWICINTYIYMYRGHSLYIYVYT